MLFSLYLTLCKAFLHKTAIREQQSNLCEGKPGSFIRCDKYKWQVSQSILINWKSELHGQTALSLQSVHVLVLVK